MQRVLVLVPRRREYAGGDAFDVYGDGGTGTIDYGSPLNPEPVRLWPTAPPCLGHLLGGHLMAGHLGAAPADGHLSDRHLCGRHLLPVSDVTFDAGPYCFGRFRHAVVMRDASGNGDVTSPVILAKTMNSEPRRASRMRLSGFDAQMDRATFAFTRSPDVG